MGEDLKHIANSSRSHICLGGVIAGDYLPRELNSKKNAIFFPIFFSHGYENCYKFQSGKFRVRHSQF
jgi:hypothetical protein